MTRTRRSFVVAVITLGVAAAIAVSSGRYPIALSTFAQLLHFPFSPTDTHAPLAQTVLVLWSVRLPRILMAILTGAALAVAGVVFQGLFKNPLVSPAILGVTTGANFGAALAMLLGGSALLLQLSAFTWGLIAVGLAYQIGKRGDHSITTLVLAGVIVSALFMAGISLIKCKADPLGQLPAIVFWTMGSFNSIVWQDVTTGGTLILIGIMISYRLRWGLNPMALGEEDARALGLDVSRRRLGYILVATLTVAAATAACGNIGWVGLVIPHMARMIVGADHAVLLPFAGLLGGIFMLAMDTLARTLPGGEIPVGILTAVVGAPFFGILLVRNRRQAWSP
ncbi:putative ABC transporter permease protein HI_1471 [Desulfosarcina cetonica]|uniref:FecCD family ABC transporter permease n=1 Tax=Desulfosarcina cetonica TaxID=90730 RepID=UPI0006D0E286|nr:iron ABC transporter permease [Desulfosarcina cetonica]VTR68464.1 putative ABC transporter permease protein HI_1471 [Desulfosarcina cetonica]